MKVKNSIETYKKRAQKYFSLCDSQNVGCDAKTGLSKPYTLSGLLCALDLGKEEFYALEKKREGRKFIKYALVKIAAFIEENALSGRLSANFAQSTLKNNFGWGEKVVTETSSVNITVSDDALKLGE